LYVDRMLSRSFMTIDNLSRYWSDKTVEQLVTALDLSAGTVSQS
jgi:hypothetical protein